MGIPWLYLDTKWSCFQYSNSLFSITNETDKPVQNIGIDITSLSLLIQLEFCVTQSRTPYLSQMERSAQSPHFHLATLVSCAGTSEMSRWS